MKPSVEDEQAKLPLLPIDWYERLVAHLRLKLIGKGTTQATTAILGSKAETWLSRFDLSHYGMLDSPELVDGVYRAVAEAQATKKGDMFVRANLEQSIDHIHEANRLYQKGIVSRPIDRTWRVLLIGAVAGGVSVYLLHRGYFHLRDRVLEADYYSWVHAYDRFFLGQSSYGSNALLRACVAGEGPFALWAKRQLMEPLGSPFMDPWVSVPVGLAVGAVAGQLAHENMAEATLLNPNGTSPSASAQPLSGLLRKGVGLCVSLGSTTLFELVKEHAWSIFPTLR